MEPGLLESDMSNGQEGFKGWTYTAQSIPPDAMLYGDLCSYAEKFFTHGRPSSPSEHKFDHLTASGLIYLLIGFNKQRNDESCEMSSIGFINVLAYHVEQIKDWKFHIDQFYHQFQSLNYSIGLSKNSQ